MIQQLTTGTMSNKRLIWVNLARVEMITRHDVAVQVPGTKLTLIGGLALDIWETPEEIAILANTPETA
jgi:hypothetical protein